jgi:hypothetical protein
MTTMTTRSGIEFDLLHPLPSMVCIEDVAWHLGGINRWCGAACRHVSVLEHALLVVEILEREFAMHDPRVLRAALHHDSEEAYTGDITGPMKALFRAIGVDPNTVTAPIRRAVQQHFGIGIEAASHAQLIKQADTLSRHTEYRDLVCPLGMQRNHPPGVTWIDLNDREGMEWDDWRLAFLDRHEELAARCELLRSPAP